MVFRSFRTVAIRGAVVGTLYFLTALVAIVSTRFAGGVAFLWVATPVLLAALMALPRRDWPSVLAACWIGSALAALFGLGLKAAPFIATVNMVEGLIAALLIRRFDRRIGRFDAVDRLVLFVIAGGLVAPLAVAPAAGLIADLATGTGFVANMVAWFTGHALGILAFTPIFLLIANGQVGRRLASMTGRKRSEALLLLAFSAATSVVVFAGDGASLLFLPMLPVILATFRLGSVGAAAAIVLVASIGAGFSIAGQGPIATMDGSAADHVRFFQFYLAATVLTALPVAADLARRGALYRRLRDSEARYRLLTESSTDIVLNLDPDGVIRYASPSIARLGGYRVDEVVGRNVGRLIVPEDVARVEAMHHAAIADPSQTFIVEFQARLKDGSSRFFETNMRAVLDGGALAGVVSVVRDVSHRKSIEAALAEAASTDPLTELANRRRFDAAFADRLARVVAGGEPGCVALFDLDHFKRVNDRHGHESGDIVLRAFARLARESVREGDLVARLGGEEFGILLSRATLAQAEQVCDRLRTVFAATELLLPDGDSVRVTASAGVAAFDGTRAAADVLRAADGALYEAKLAGRDRLRLAA